MNQAHTKIMCSKLIKEEESLTDWLWQRAEASGYLEQALNTKLIQGIKNGNLHPESYGPFMVQDYAYQEEAAILFERAEEDIKRLDIQDQQFT